MPFQRIQVMGGENHKSLIFVLFRKSRWLIKEFLFDFFFFQHLKEKLLQF